MWNNIKLSIAHAHNVYDVDISKNLNFLYGDRVSFHGDRISFHGHRIDVLHGDRVSFHGDRISFDGHRIDFYTVTV